MHVEGRGASIGDVLPNAGPHLRLRNHGEAPRKVDERHALADDIFIRIAVSPLVDVVARSVGPERKRATNRRVGFAVGMSPISGEVPTSAAFGRLVLIRLRIAIDMETLASCRKA